MKLDAPTLAPVGASLPLVRPDGGKTLHFYLGVGDACNLACRYCYLPKKRLSENKDAEAMDATRRLIQKIKEEGYAVGVASLHGAEPGLLSPEAMATCLSELLAANGFSHRVGLQSNGTLFNRTYMDRFDAALPLDVRPFLTFGISLDGPAVITDAVRGRDVFARVARNLADINARGYFTRILAVVGRHTLDHLDAFKDWVDAQVEAGQALRFKPAHGTYAMDASGQHVFADWLVKTGHVRFYQEIFAGMCSTRGNACQFYEFDVSGAVVACNKTRDAFTNWHDESLETIVQKRHALFAQNTVHPDCPDCPMFALCHSGCPCDRAADGTAVDCPLKRALVAGLTASGLSLRAAALAFSLADQAAPFSGKHAHAL